MENRITRTQLFLGVAFLFSKRSVCLKKQVGCVIVKDKRIISSGYNGVLPNVDPKFGLDSDGITHTVHAEANAIAFAAKKGISLEGSSIYLTLSPCEKCTELLIQAGIKEVTFIEQYRDISPLEILAKNNVFYQQVNLEENVYIPKP